MGVKGAGTNVGGTAKPLGVGGAAVISPGTPAGVLGTAGVNGAGTNVGGTAKPLCVGGAAVVSPGTRAGVLGIADVGAVTFIGADGGNAAALALAGFLFGFGSGLGFAFPFALTACAFGCVSVFGDAFPFALTVFAFGDALPFAPSFAERNADFDTGRFMVSRLALDRRLRSAASSQLLPMLNLRLEARMPTVSCPVLLSRW